MKKLLRLTLATAMACGLLAGAAAQEAVGEVKGDVKAGGKKVDACIGCHSIPGYQASFPEVYKVPMIAGQNAKYLLSALMGYRKGERKHPTMRAMASSLSDQDMADVAAYYAQLAKADAAPAQPPAAPAQVAALIAKSNCTSCHGSNFSKPIDAGYPKLAGQHADYLYAALKSYQTDNNPKVGRNNAIMMGMSRPYTHAELKAIAAYVSSLPSELKVVPQSRFR